MRSPVVDNFLFDKPENILMIDIKMIQYFLKQGVKINQTKTKNFVRIPRKEK
ncbi:MAG: hypothetical protein ABI663_14525 [Chryseolinea sp.]